MFVVLKIGSRAGEIVEMKYTDAKPLLEDGRASKWPPEEIYIPAAEAVEPIAAAPQLPKPAPKRKGKYR